MTTQDPADKNDSLVEVEGLPAELVIAALYAVADSPGMGALQRTAEPLSLDDARAMAAEAEYGFDYVRGRLLKFSIRDGAIDPFAYNRDNADGLPLAAAVVEALRGSDPGALMAGFGTPDGAARIADVAFGALEELSPARATRIGVVDGRPADSATRAAYVVAVAAADRVQLSGGISMFQALQRIDAVHQDIAAAWVMADEKLRVGVETDPVQAFENAVTDLVELATIVGSPMSASHEAALTHASKWISGALSGLEGGERVRAWRAIPASFQTIVEAFVPEVVASMQRELGIAPDPNYGK